MLYMFLQYLLSMYHIFNQSHFLISSKTLLTIFINYIQNFGFFMFVIRNWILNKLVEKPLKLEHGMDSCYCFWELHSRLQGKHVRSNGEGNASSFNVYTRNKQLVLKPWAQYTKFFVWKWEVIIGFWFFLFQ